MLSWASLGRVTREVASIIARPVPNARLLAYFLNGSWRRECPPLSLTPTEVARAAPLLIGSGAAALGWRRVKETPALKGIIEQKAVVAGFEQEMEDRQGDIDRIVEDQGRLRENMKALRGSAEEKALLQRYTRQLDEQETQLDTLRKKIRDTEAQRDAANEKLQKRIGDLQLEATL